MSERGEKHIFYIESNSERKLSFFQIFSPRRPHIPFGSNALRIAYTNNDYGIHFRKCVHCIRTCSYTGLV